METSNETKANNSFFMKNISSIKAVVIGIMALLLFIPLAMVDDLAHDREGACNIASDEVSDMWSNPQTIAGPILVSQGEEKMYTILPETLNVEDSIITEVRKRGIFEVVVYHTIIKLDGTFVYSEEINSIMKEMDSDQLLLFIQISDLRGIEENVQATFGNENYNFSSGLGGMADDSGISAMVTINRNDIAVGDSIPFSTVMKLKGSRSISFAPVGNINNVLIKSDYSTPSFCGNFLPTERTITEDGFSANWNVLGMNRNYPQIIEQTLSSSRWSFFPGVEIENSRFGVELRVPLTQYQLTHRAIKYGLLIILLVFVAAFMVEISSKRAIHILQYLIIGLALVLFYSLLLSISEYLSFGIAYLIASVMTITLLTAYFKGILHHQSAYYLGGLLVVLYAFVYMLLQMEVYALLVGSLGLFVILGTIMYFTRTLSNR